MHIANAIPRLLPSSLPRRALLILRGLVLVIAPLAFGLTWEQAVPLGSAANFGVLGGSAVTNTGNSEINGNVGVWPGTAITGFPPGVIFLDSGSIHAGDAVAQQGQSDLTTAYVSAAGLPCGTTIAGGLLGGLILAPGVYCMGAADLTGTLTLSGPGTYVFQIASSLTTATGSQVVFAAGATSCNVFWQITSSATLDTYSRMAGNVLALSSITINTGAVLNGRALARNGQVSLDSNDITPCIADATPATPTLQTRTDGAILAGVPTSDHATLAGGDAPTGSILFELFGPGDATCSQATIFTSSQLVSGNGDYVSAPFTPTTPGIYQWVATYSGDSNNLSIAGACGDITEQFSVRAVPQPARAVPSLSAFASTALAIFIILALTPWFKNPLAPVLDHDDRESERNS